VLALQAVYTAAYLLIGVVFATVELLGVWSRKRGDTLSEHWWWLQHRAPVLARLALVLFLAWLVPHLLIHA
jgi:hypothetical protein